MVAEVLACNIPSNCLISGLTVPGSPSSLPVVSAYADDTTLVVSSVPALLAVFDVYSLYERGLGASLHCIVQSKQRNPKRPLSSNLS